MLEKKTLYGISGFLFTAGAALIALQQSGKLATYDSDLLTVGAIVILTGIATVVVAITSGAYPTLGKLIFYIRGEASYITEQATVRDLPHLFEYYQRIFGNDLIPQEEFTKWMIKNPTICHKVICVKSYKEKTSSRVAGFFDFEPLTSHAHKRLVKGIIEGWGLSTKDILSPRTVPKSYYIGSVGTTSKSHKDRAATLLCTLEHVRRINLKRPITLLTNPITPDGLRLCQGFGFRPVNEERPRGVWSLELPTNAHVPRYERKLMKAIYGRYDA